MIDIKNPDELFESIELFYFAYRSFTAHPDRVLAQRGLGRVHHRILYFVGRNPAIAVNALTEILKVSKQALNAPLRRLVESGLIAVKFATHDGRVKQLSLTREGKQLERMLTNTQMKQVAAAFEAAGPQAADAWSRVMRAFAS